MTFSISKMLKDGFGAFFNNIGFLLTVTAITAVAGFSLKLLLYSFSHDVLGDGSIHNILYSQLSYVEPTGSYASPHVAIKILFGLLDYLILSFQVAVVCQVALCISDKSFSYWKIVQHSSSPLLLLRLVLLSYFVSLFTDLLNSVSVVVAKLFVMLLIAAFFPIFLCCKAGSQWGGYLFVQSLLPLVVIGSEWFFFRLSFAIPHIFQGDSFFASIKKGWKGTKQLPISAFLVIFCMMRLANFPLLPPVVDWQLNALTLAVLMFYSHFIRVLQFFLVLASWHQVGNSKETICQKDVVVTV